MKPTLAALAAVLTFALLVAVAGIGFGFLALDSEVQFHWFLGCAAVAGLLWVRALFAWRRARVARE